MLQKKTSCGPGEAILCGEGGEGSSVAAGRGGLALRAPRDASTTSRSGQGACWPAAAALARRPRPTVRSPGRCSSRGRSLGPYSPEDGEWQAVVAMRDLLRELYSDKPPTTDLRAPEVLRAYRANCCKAGCQSNYLFYLEEDVTTAVANAARLGVGLGAVCADVVESLNAIK